MAEARAAAYTSMTLLAEEILSTQEAPLEIEAARSIYASLLRGLEDYSIDRRGDIGSL